MKIDEVLKKFPHLAELFKGFPKELDLYIEKFTSGAIIAQRGDPIKKVMVLSSGDMVVYNEYEGGEVIYVQSDEVTFIGDIELISGKDSFVCSVAAINDCSAVAMSIQDFFKWFETDNYLPREMAIRLAKRNCIQSSNTGSLKYLSTQHRVSKYIVDLTSEHIKGNNEATIKITREIIACYVGASVRMVNRVIRKLKEDGYINTGYGNLTITREQYDRLKEVLQNDLRTDY